MPEKKDLGQFWHKFEFSHLRFNYSNYVWKLAEELQLFHEIFN